jgi:putative restriction endonuclease
MLRLDVNPDLALRLAAIQHAQRLSRRWGDAIPASELTRGFSFEGTDVLLVAWGRGVFKPKQLSDGPLTLVSSLAPKYQDERLEGHVMLYDYAPAHSDEWANVGLKRLAELGRPVILLKQVKPKPNPEYMVFAPVAIAGFDDYARKFRLDLAAGMMDAATPVASDATSTPKRYRETLVAPDPRLGLPIAERGPIIKGYRETIVQARIHQAYFRRDILTAYRGRCCVCSLRERPLLDAAHIIPDSSDEGVAEVQNGLSMCPTHHRAFDRDLLVVKDDYRVEVRRDRLRFIEDEATVKTLVDFDGKEILRPEDVRCWPDPALLRRKVELAA